MVTGSGMTQAVADLLTRVVACASVDARIPGDLGRYGRDVLAVVEEVARLRRVIEAQQRREIFEAQARAGVTNADQFGGCR